MQDRKQSVTIPSPNLGANKIMVQLFVAAPNDPLFVIRKTATVVPLTDSVSGKHLKEITINWGTAKPLTFHAFRRAGVMWALQQGVLLEHIMRHGTWKLDAVWS